MLVAVILAGFGCAPSAAAACYASSCKVIPCSTTQSAENGLHTPDDAIAAQQNIPVGCDDTMPKVP